MNGVYDPRDYQAKGNGENNDTAAIQTAIDACHQNGGGMVCLSPGKYLSGSLCLKSGVFLHLLPGACILGSKNVKDYPLNYLIYAKEAEDIGIIGYGSIHGQGDSFWPGEKELNEDVMWRKDWGEVSAYYRQCNPRPQGLICFEGCKNIHVTDVTMENSPRWTFHLLGCKNADIRGVTIHSPFYGPNTDGIDIDGSQEVTVSNCRIETGDDAIVIKTTGENGNALPVRNVTISNCILSTTCNAFKIGTETKHDIQNVVFTNSVVYSAPEQPYHGRAISGVSIEMVDGASLSQVTVSNIIMKNARCPIFIRLGNRGRGQDKPIPGRLSNIQIDNIQAYGAILPCILSGIQEASMKNITLTNINMSVEGGAAEEVTMKEVSEIPADYPEAVMFGRWLPGYGLFCRYITDVTLLNVNIWLEKPDSREGIFMTQTENLRYASILVDGKPWKSSQFDY